MPRQYQHTQELLPPIKKMPGKGMTHKEIETHFVDSISAFKEKRLDFFMRIQYNSKVDESKG